MNVKIVSDGQIGTRVELPDGTPLAGVMSITWRAAVSDFARADIELCIIEIDAVAQARFYGPSGKEIRRIEYTDGSTDEYPED